jgi:2-desacetyl-2-hydroxyethyl bacteriochlorophyllide A dehydrogenase
MKIRSVIIHGVKDVSIVDDELDVETLNPHMVLIENTVSFISPGTELSRVFGLKVGATYPVRPGYCSLGTVIKKGDKVKHVNIGDKVIHSGAHASAYLYDQSNSESGNLYKMDPRLSDREGAVLKMCWISMNGILCVDVKIFDTVVIFGLGILGQVVALLYKQMGVKVIVVDPVQSRCEQAKDLGLTNIVNCPPNEQVKAVMSLTNNKGANIVVDATGISAAIDTAIQCAAKNAQVVLLGSPRVDHVANMTPLLNAIHMKNLSIKGALNRLYTFEEKDGSSLSIRRGLDYLSELMINKTIDVEKFITHTIKPEDIMEAYEGLMNNKEVYRGVIIDWK